MDELRDYRFYREDLLHPNPTAINYIWKRFTETWMTQETRQLLKKVESLVVAHNHKPFNPASKAHKEFLRLQEQKVLELKKQIPHLIFK